jgi:[ribosomal protein S5]-alanine N-acetyltransferase
MHLLASLLTPKSRHPRPPVDTRLTGPRVMLRFAAPSDWRAWSGLREASRDFLVPWEPQWPSDSLTYPYFCRMLHRQQREWRRGRAYAFCIFLRDETLIGSVTLNDIQRGIAQKATLGYWIGEAYAGQGLMTAAAGLVCAFAYHTLKLHRLEASCLPHNEPSAHLLRRLGFEEEGFAKSYLRVNGSWQDHVLWGKAAS